MFRAKPLALDVDSGVLAQEMGTEFKTLFDDYSDDLRELNAALRANI
jgi:hypothetical protein